MDSLTIENSIVEPLKAYLKAQLRMVHHPQGHWYITKIVEGYQVISLFSEMHPAMASKVRELTEGKFDDLALWLRLRRGQRVRVADAGAGQIVFEIPKVSPSQLQVSQLATTTSGLIIPLGIDTTQHLATVNFTHPLTPHLGVFGLTGGGKSVLLNVVLYYLTKQNTPHDVKVALVDLGKGGRDYLQFGIANVPHRLAEVVTSVGAAYPLIAWFEQELERRNRSGTSHPRLFLAIEEAPDVGLDRTLAERVGRLVEKGRAAGIHVLLVAQKPTKGKLQSDVMSNISARVCYRTTKAQESAWALGIPGSGAEMLAGPGDALYHSPEQPLLRVATPWLDVPAAQGLAELVRLPAAMPETSSNPAPGRPTDELDLVVVGQLISYIAHCITFDQQPLAISTLGRKLSPMMSAPKMARHWEAAKEIFRASKRTNPFT